MLAHMQSLKKFTQVGFHAASGTVWGIYTDGVLHAVLNNVDFSNETGRQAKGRTELGASRSKLRDSELSVLVTADQWRQIHLYESIPSLPYPHITDDVVEPEQLRRLAESVQFLGMNVVGMNVDGQFNSDPASLDQLKTVSGDGVFFYTGYGAHIPMELKPISILSSSTVVVREGKIERSIRADLKAQRAAIVSCPVPGEGGVAEVSWTSRVGITELFINHYKWSFPKNSVVFINAPFSKPLESAFLARGANTFLGWDAVPSVCQQIAVGKDLMHLFAGTDYRKGSKGSIPAQPPLRSCGLRETLEYLADEGLLSVGAAPGESGSLTVSAPRNGAIANQMRPSIESLTVDEIRGQVLVRGQLGEASPEKKVWISGTLPEGTGLLETADGRIAGKDLVTGQWTTRSAAAYLIGNFGSGWVQIKEGNRWSNAVPLTEIGLKVEFDLASAGSLAINVTFDLSVRGMLQGYRLNPSDDPLKNGSKVPMTNTMDMLANWTASGSATHTDGETTTTISWTGGGQVSARLQDPDLSVSGSTTFDLSRLVGSLAIDLVDNRGFKETTVVTTASGTTTTESVVPLAISTKPEWRDPAGGQEPLRLLPEFLSPDRGTESYLSASYGRFRKVSDVTVSWLPYFSGPRPEQNRGQR